MTTFAESRVMPWCAPRLARILTVATYVSIVSLAMDVPTLPRWREPRERMYSPKSSRVSEL
jgi:hypothetical protein